MTLLDRNRRRDTWFAATASAFPVAMFIAAAMALVDGCTRL
jgi:hypothetical protein